MSHGADTRTSTIRLAGAPTVRAAVPSVLRYERGADGVMRGVVDHPSAKGAFSLRGARITDWRPARQEPVLWISRGATATDAPFSAGGVPICFPWFGRHPHDPDAPGHGLARLAVWQVADTRIRGAGVRVALQTHLDQYRLTYRVTFGRKLTMTLAIENLADEPATCEAALHSYFRVSDVRQVVVHGLENTGYVDKTRQFAPRPATGTPLRITGPIDRIYRKTTAACEIEDPGMRRRIRIAASGAGAAVVWNPWCQSAAARAGFSDGDWREMLCVETAAVGDDALVVPAHGRRVIEAMVSVLPAELERGGRRSSEGAVA